MPSQPDAHCIACTLLPGVVDAHLLLIVSPADASGASLLHSCLSWRSGHSCYMLHGWRLDWTTRCGCHNRTGHPVHACSLLEPHPVSVGVRSHADCTWC